MTHMDNEVYMLALNAFGFLWVIGMVFGCVAFGGVKPLPRNRFGDELHKIPNRYLTEEKPRGCGDCIIGSCCILSVALYFLLVVYMQKDYKYESGLAGCRFLLLLCCVGLPLLLYMLKYIYVYKQQYYYPSSSTIMST